MCYGPLDMVSTLYDKKWPTISSHQTVPLRINIATLLSQVKNVLYLIYRTLCSVTCN
jgi:hypothetical protein